MNVRASLKAMLNFEKPDNICQFEWGYWDEVLTRWTIEGLSLKPTVRLILRNNAEKIKDLDYAQMDKDVSEAIGITYYHRVPVEVRIFPPFEKKVISENDNTKVIQDEDGIIKEVSKSGTVFPKFIKHPVGNMADFEKLKPRLDPSTPGRFPENWKEVTRKLSQRNSILALGRTEISFFGWHRDLIGVKNLCTSYYDQPELVHAISRHHVRFLKELYSKIMSDMEFDFIFMWEDMCYKNGLMISPGLIREFMLPYYREIIDFFKSVGDHKILVDSDGDVRKLIPLFTEAGVDGMLPFECVAGMDIRGIREEFPDLIIAGGIDKREVAKGRKFIDKELEGKLPFMFKHRGYIPTLDHHVPPEISFEDFQYYLRKVREIYKKCK